MRALDRLVASSYGLNIADQIALVAVPIVAATVFGASASTIGLLVACQSMAHLVGSLPFGVLVDRTEPRSAVLASALLSLGGFAAAALAIGAGAILPFAGAIALAGLGIVLYGLASLSMLPRIVAQADLARANAAISLPRSVASLAVPLALGLMLDVTGAAAVFWFAGACALSALILTAPLPKSVSRPQQREALIRRLAKGAGFVLRHPMLLPITFCAVFWNFAFAMLVVLAVPVITQDHGGEATLFAGAMAAFGLASVAGTYVAGRIAGRIAPRLVLMFGPGSSVVAAAMLLALPQGNPGPLLMAAFFVLGFGPSMWLVTQNTVRQLVTPAQMLGRVNAVIQTAIYGTRPLGALAGGAIATAVTPQAGLAVVAALFALSFAVVLASRLTTVADYGALAIAEETA
ncbi:MFS transporter [Stappia sp. TSB10P1A]|uniref:MFS transporter n=1 Tax=Stappia sp. TSB10P1A TaxID=2003585 RepID=UPI001643BC82|nr:MFS transporter [Stappia sp. TSB10P1A]